MKSPSTRSSGSGGGPTIRLGDALPWLAALRDDERARATARFRHVSLAAGARLDGAHETPLLGVVLAGRLRVRRTASGIASASTALWPGDRWDEVAVFADVPGDTVIEADTAATVALLDRAGFLALASDFPIVWLAVAERLSRELKMVSNVLREMQDFAASEGAQDSLARLLDAKRREVGRRGGISRAALGQLFARFVAGHVREPAFWVLAGFAGAVLTSRVLVGLILRFGLQQRFFNLHDSGGANPLHVHHFNYGFAIVVATGLLAFFPGARRMLRLLATVFGIGLGLVFDEFALIWNLHPDYYQPLNYWAQALLVVLLVQLLYFRRLYAELFELLLARMGRWT